jgi:hypothetical protein
MDARSAQQRIIHTNPVHRRFKGLFWKAKREFESLPVRQLVPGSILARKVFTATVI